MKLSLHRPLARRWLLPILIMLLVVGHACELPAFADLVVQSDAAEDSHHSGGDHGNENLVSCDGVGISASPPYSHLGLGLDVGAPVPGAGPALLTAATPCADDPARLPTRPPLFLLFA